MKNILGEYYSFFKQMTWKYDLHLNWINFYRNDRQPFMANRIKPEAFCYLSLQTKRWRNQFVYAIRNLFLGWKQKYNGAFTPRIAILQFNRNYYIADNKII